MGSVWKIFRRRRGDSDLRVKSRSEHLSGARPLSIDISAYAPSLAGLIAGCAYQHYVAYRFLSEWVRDADSSASRFDFAAIAAAEYDKFSQFRKAFLIHSPDADLRESVVSPDHIDAAYGMLTPRAWQEAALQAYVVGGLLDGAQLSICNSVTGVPEPVASRISDDTVALSIVDLLSRQVESGEFSRDLLALWGRAVVGDALLAVRSLLVLPDDVRAAIVSGERPDESVAMAIAQIDAFQSQLVAEHTLRMDALHLTA